MNHRSILKSLVLASVLSLSFITTAKASDIYPVQAKTGWLIGGNVALTNAIDNKLGLGGQFQFGYDNAFNRVISLGIESGAGVMTYPNHSHDLYLLSLPLLASGKVILPDGIMLGLKLGVTGFLSVGSSEVNQETSVSPTYELSAGFKPTNSLTLSLSFRQNFEVNVNQSNRNISQVSFGVSYIFGANPVNEEALFASQFNVKNNLPWYR